ncbi:MAG: SpoIVB peptidase [Oscillospiraceae bacterium]|nr:SpoIVB peptidase [Oscillospiraceae bacterium]
MSRILSVFILSAFILSAAVFGLADFIVPEKITVFNAGEIDKNNFIKTNKDDSRNPEDGIYTASLFGLIPIKKVQVNIFPEASLIPGGMPFGVKFFTEGVVVVGVSDIETDKGAVNPAKTAGIKTSDIITKINGIEVGGVEETAQIIESSKGEVLTLGVIRDGRNIELKLKPVFSVSENKYKSGIWLRDSTAGIGTVTFISPANYVFGGLGHGICDVDTGNLMPLRKGAIVDADISSAIKGKPEAPGELKGKFKENMGTLLANTQNGIFGILSNMPVSPENSAPVPVGLGSDIKEGPAVIYSTVDESGVREFQIEIIKIYKNSSDSKNFLVKITDPELLEITGGIVQGMSGSPIMQNGKIIGAVTHVLVSDPSKGYGISMENMFSSMPDVLK